MDLHKIYDYGIGFVFICNILNLMLPPWDLFNSSPRFQGVYKNILIFIGYWGSMNFKSKIWTQISVDNQVAKAMNGGNGNGKSH